MPTVFISYASPDEPTARSLFEFLEKNGVSAFFAPADQRAGPFSPRLAREIETCQALLVIASVSATEKTWVKEEVFHARDHAKAILPLVIGAYDDVPTWLRFILGPLQRYPIERTSNDEAFQQVLSAIGKLPKRGRIISILNMKGGVGKTILTANLASAVFRRDNLDILLIDFDPQHNLTQLFFSREAKEKFWSQGLSVKALVNSASVVRGPEYPKLIDNSRGKFEIVPGTDELLEYTLGLLGQNEMDAARAAFRRNLETMRDQYQVVMIDLNPAATFLTRCALECSDHVLVPVKPEQFASLGLNLLARLVDYHVPRIPFPKIPTDFTTVLNGVGDTLLPVTDTDLDRTIRDEIRQSNRWSRTLCPTEIRHNRFLRASRVGKIPLRPVDVTAAYRKNVQNQLREVLYSVGRHVFERAGVTNARRD